MTINCGRIVLDYHLFHRKVLSIRWVDLIVLLMTTIIDQLTKLYQIDSSNGIVKRYLKTNQYHQCRLCD